MHRYFRTLSRRCRNGQIESVGAYFAYLRHPFPGRTAQQVAEKLATERGVLCLPGSYFGPGQEGHLRVAIANVGADVLSGLTERFRGLCALMPPSRRSATYCGAAPLAGRWRDGYSLDQTGHPIRMPGDQF